jgi:hypothetical protein
MRTNAPVNVYILIGAFLYPSVEFISRSIPLYKPAGSDP